MSKIKRIISGWKNFKFPRVEMEVMAQQRAVHCSTCEHSKEMPFEVIQENKIKELKKMGCMMCLCPLSAKLRSPEEVCPLQKW